VGKRAAIQPERHHRKTLGKEGVIIKADDLILYDFNLTSLIKLGSLNIRRVAEEDRRLTEAEYFRMLSLFLSLAPDVGEALKRFSENDADTKDWKAIETMIALFKEMGCDTHLPDLYAVSNARSKGDHRLAAFHADKAAQGFSEFRGKIAATKAASVKGADPDPNATLYTCLRKLDEEEAARKLLVLAVDDSTAILEAVAAVLSESYKVFKLPKPTMLENVLKQVVPELFLLDYLMPELNGFELIPIIRGFEEHKDTPIIFLTSEGTMDNVTAALALGACDFVVKPFNPDQLRKKVEKHIVRKNNLR
jgi:CheY-like chemotaxis protein